MAFGNQRPKRIKIKRYPGFNAFRAVNQAKSSRCRLRVLNALSRRFANKLRHKGCGASISSLSRNGSHTEKNIRPPKTSQLHEHQSPRASYFNTIRRIFDLGSLEGCLEKCGNNLKRGLAVFRAHILLATSYVVVGAV